MLGEEINMRLDLLLESKQVSQQTYHIVKKILEDLIQKNKLNVTNEISGQFANHLSIATERINRNEPIEEVTEQTEELIREHPDLYEEAKSILENCIYTESAQYTKAEAGFITLYLTIFKETREN